MASSAPARFNAPEESRLCFSCASRRTTEFLGEICLHFPGGIKELGQASGFDISAGRRLLGLRLGQIYRAAEGVEANSREPMNGWYGWFESDAPILC